MRASSPWLVVFYGCRCNETSTAPSRKALWRLCDTYVPSTVTLTFGLHPVMTVSHFLARIICVPNQHPKSFLLPGEICVARYWVSYRYCPKKPGRTGSLGIAAGSGYFSEYSVWLSPSAAYPLVRFPTHCSNAPASIGLPK